MTALKTRPTGASVTAFLEAVEHPRRREDGLALLAFFERVTGAAAEMWGPSIIGFGCKDITYADGRVEEWMRTGFSPRKQNLALYVMDGVAAHEGALAELGKHKTGRACLYVNKLADIELSVLERIIKASFRG